MTATSSLRRSGWPPSCAGSARAELVPARRHPLVVGEVPASSGGARAPTVLLYGHVDVQPVGLDDDWSSPPFEPTVRDGWLYARGAGDDKGNLFLLLKALERLVHERRLPVNVLVVCDGEEECGGDSVSRFVEDDDRALAAAMFFDGPMPAHDLPAFKLATRGLVYLRVGVRTGDRDVHSGMYGGAALNAVDAMLTALAAVRGVPPELRAGTLEPSAAELEDWALLPPGEAVLADGGVRPSDGAAARQFYERTLGATALDLNGIRAGEAGSIKTIVPASCEATLSVRLAAGQEPDAVADACTRLLRDAAPAGAELDVAVLAAVPPSFTDPASPALRLALAAFERALGRRPALSRSGGTVPIRTALSARGIPTIHTGFDSPAGNAHGPDERLYVPYVGVGVEAAVETLLAFGQLAPG